MSQPLRSQAWFAKMDKDGFIYRSWMKRGLPDDAFDGRPVIGILTSWSEAAPCNMHLDAVAEHVRRGVLDAGGLPLVIPAMSLGESLVRPTAMLYRNLMSMVVEECIRMNPLDGVVLLCGCDKTTAAMLLGAASADLPTMIVTGGPMLTGRMHGQPLGSGTDLWRLSEDLRSGAIATEDFIAAESCMTRSAGFCNTMGTASTLSLVSEALGLSLAGMGAVPAVDSRRARGARLSGRRIVELVAQDCRFSDVVTRAAIETAIITLAALGGSTNAVVHLLALAGRLGVPLTLDDFEALGSEIPLLVNLMPSGKYLMEDFFDAGGLPAVIAALASLLKPGPPTVSGQTLVDQCADARSWNPDVIASLDAPVQAAAGIRVLRGNLAPSGAIIKPSAATPALLAHRGRAVVFEGPDDLHSRIDTADIDEADVLVLRNCGPRGYPGMPEVGNMPLPRRLLEKGVRDMVRVSDARMSGTAFGTVVLHVAPEAAVNGPLNAVETGDEISLDVAGGALEVNVGDDELAARLARKGPRPAPETRGYGRLYVEHVLQADQGADFDFLVGSTRAGIPRESH